MGNNYCTYFIRHIFIYQFIPLLSMIVSIYYLLLVGVLNAFRFPTLFHLRNVNTDTFKNSAISLGL